MNSSYLQGAPTRNSRGRPPDTGPTVEPPLALGRNKEEDLTQSFRATVCMFVCACVRAPTLLGPITLFFTFFVGAGFAAGSFVLDSVETERRLRCYTSKLAD